MMQPNIASDTNLKYFFSLLVVMAVGSSDASRGDAKNKDEIKALEQNLFNSFIV
jgi:hypothetical protein